MYNLWELVDSIGLYIIMNLTDPAPNFFGLTQAGIRGVRIPTASVYLRINWNTVSRPVSSPRPDDSVRHVYTTSVFPYAFRFNNGYVQSYALENGPGYWIKSSAYYTQDIIGIERDTLTIPVDRGWNLIGSISTQIDTSEVFVTPSVPGLCVSNFFDYDNGYVVAARIYPGRGYWVRASQAGSFFMHVTGPAKPAATPAGRSIEELNSITIRDAGGGSQTLYFGADATGEIAVSMYTMPPVPPQGSFDARFESAGGGTMVQTHPSEVSEAIELPITIRSSAYPLTVTWKVNAAEVAYELRASEDVVQTLTGEGTLRIGNDAVNRLSLRVVGGSSALPKEYALLQNYPNPFNPVTVIRFEVPSSKFVTLKVYDLLGREVATLVNEAKQPGTYDVTFDATNLPSGVYFYRLTAGEFVATRKLVLLR